jgi:hypothetical protein
VTTLFKIDESVKHEYAKKLEEHKAQLQEQLTHSIQYMKAKSQENIDQKTTDKALFTKLLDTLPSSGSIEFVGSHVVEHSSFDRDNLGQLRRFSQEWARPENYFLDSEFDKKREHLLEIVDEYLHYLACNTFIDDRKEFNISSIPGEWITEQTERYNKTVETLNNLANQLVAAHTDLINMARKKLKC